MTVSHPREVRAIVCPINFVLYMYLRKRLAGILEDLFPDRMNFCERQIVPRGAKGYFSGCSGAPQDSPFSYGIHSPQPGL